MELFDPYLFLLQPPYLWWWAGGLAVALFLALSGMVWRRKTRGIVPFRAAGGRVEIAPHTIRTVIRHTVLGVEGVEKVKVKTSQRGAKTVVKLDLEILANAPIPVCEAEIKRRVRKALSHQFGMEQLAPITLRFSKIVGEPRSLEDEALPAAREELQQLPRYEPDPEETKVTDDYDQPLTAEAPRDDEAETRRLA